MKGLNGYSLFHSTILLTILIGIANCTACVHGPVDQPGCFVHSWALQGEIASLALVKELPDFQNGRGPEFKSRPVHHIFSSDSR